MDHIFDTTTNLIVGSTIVSHETITDLTSITTLTMLSTSVSFNWGPHYEIQSWRNATESHRQAVCRTISSVTNNGVGETSTALTLTQSSSPVESVRSSKVTSTETLSCWSFNQTMVSCQALAIDGASGVVTSSGSSFLVVESTTTDLNYLTSEGKTIIGLSTSIQTGTSSVSWKRIIYLLFCFLSVYVYVCS